MLFSSSKRNTKVLNTGKMNKGWKAHIQRKKNHCKIKINKDSIEQKQLVNDLIRKIDIAALCKMQRKYKWFYDNY